jgi:predicted nucleic acid-binding protein
MKDKPLSVIDTNILIFAIDANENKKRTAFGLCEENAVISINV